MTYVALVLLASLLPGLLVLAACILSSRISHRGRAPRPGHALRPGQYRPVAKALPPQNARQERAHQGG